MGEQTTLAHVLGCKGKGRHKRRASGEQARKRDRKADKNLGNPKRRKERCLQT